MALQPGITSVLFAKEQTSKDIMVVPAGADVVRMIDAPDIGQDKNSGYSRERINSYSRTSLVERRYGPGSARFATQMKRTGDPVTSVQGLSTLLRNLMGIGPTLDPGVKNVYSLATRTTAEKYLSLFYRDADQVIQIRGFQIFQGSFPISASLNEDSDFEVQLEGEFLEMYWAGTAVLAEALTTTAVGLDKFNVGTSEDAWGKFKEGAFVTIPALGTSHKITDVDEVTGDITVSPAFGSNQAIGSTITGYMPTEVDSGFIVNGYRGYFQEDADNLEILSGTIVVNNAKQTIATRKNNSAYPAQIARAGNRTVEIQNLRVHADWESTPPSDIFQYIADRLISKAVICDMGNEPGLMWKLRMPITKFRNPRLRNNDIVEVEWMQVGLGSSAYDDEFSIWEM